MGVYRFKRLPHSSFIVSMYICILQNCTPIHTGDIAHLLIKIRLQIFGNPPNPKNIYFPNNMNLDMRERERERERGESKRER